MYRRELLAGLLSGLIGWAGAFVLPENSWVLDVYPGVVLALAFYWAMPPAQGTALLPRLIAVGCYLAGCIGGWRLAIEVAVRFTQTLPYVWAGLAGGAAVALACLLAWRRTRGAIATFATITLAGGLGGAIFQGIDTRLHTLGEDFWVLVLLMEWQTLVLLAAGWARRRYAPAGPPQA